MRIGEPEYDWIERVALKTKPEGAIRLPDMDAKDLPTRESRNAWRFKNNKIEVDTKLIGETV